VRTVLSYERDCVDLDEKLRLGQARDHGEGRVLRDGELKGSVRETFDRDPLTDLMIPDSNAADLAQDTVTLPTRSEPPMLRSRTSAVLEHLGPSRARMSSLPTSSPFASSATVRRDEDQVAHPTAENRKTRGARRRCWGDRREGGHVAPHITRAAGLTGGTRVPPRIFSGARRTGTLADELVELFTAAGPWALPALSRFSMGRPPPFVRIVHGDQVRSNRVI